MPILDFRILFANTGKSDRVALARHRYCIKVGSANVVAGIRAYDPVIVFIGGGVQRVRTSFSRLSGSNLTSKFDRGVVIGLTADAVTRNMKGI